MPRDENVRLKPIGILPRNTWEQLRIDELQEAIIRYTLDNLEVPNEWKEELSEMNVRKLGTVK